MPIGRRGERGYTLVAVAMIVAVTNILVAAALPLWSARIRRDKEAELISRGFQYAEAIRVFQKRFGRLPVRLEELLNVEPRSLRKLWPNPIGEGAGWAAIVELPGHGLIALDVETGQPIVPIDRDGDGVPEPLPVQPPASDAEEGEGPPLGPIHGVKSREKGEAFHTLFDSDDYGDWEFTIEVLQQAVAKPGPSGLPPRANAFTIGRPFRFPPPGTLGEESQGAAPGQRPGPRPRQGQPPVRPGGG